MTAVARIRLFCGLAAIAGEFAHSSGPPGGAAWRDRPGACRGEGGGVGSLTGLRERRAFWCRLTPGRALRSLAEAEVFLRDRGLLTRTAGCALPGLYEACHEDRYKPASRGFAAWPAAKWPWFGELAGRGYVVAAVHRGKNPARDRRGGAPARPDLPRGDRAHARGRPRLGPAAGSSRRRGTIEHRRPAHRARAHAAGADGAARTAGAVRRDHLALAAGDRRRGTPASE